LSRVWADLSALYLCYIKLFSPDHCHIT
jgi:hypothetical protein